MDRSVRWSAFERRETGDRRNQPAGRFAGQTPGVDRRRFQDRSRSRREGRRRGDRQGCAIPDHFLRLRHGRSRRAGRSTKRCRRVLAVRRRFQVRPQGYWRPRLHDGQQHRQSGVCERGVGTRAKGMAQGVPPPRQHQRVPQVVGPRLRGSMESTARHRSARKGSVQERRSVDSVPDHADPEPGRSAGLHLHRLAHARRPPAP